MAAGKFKAVLTSKGELKLKISSEDLAKMYREFGNTSEAQEDNGIEVDVYLHKKISDQDQTTDNNVNIDIGEVEFLSKKLGLDKNSTSSFLNSFGSLNSGKA